MPPRIALASLALIAACGPSNSVSGTVAGTGFTIKEAIVGPLRTSSSGSGLTTTAAAMVLSDTAGWCDSLKANRMKKNTRSLVILLTNRPDRNTMLAPAAGDFTVIQQSSALGNLATAQVLELDGSCTSSGTPDAGSPPRAWSSWGSSSSRPAARPRARSTSRSAPRRTRSPAPSPPPTASSLRPPAVPAASSRGQSA